ncbi:MAG: chloride channel protein [Pseudomonadota bacterium]
MTTQTERARTAWQTGLQMLREQGPGQIQFWFIALAVGAVAGGAAVLFRMSVNALQQLVYGTEDVRMLHTFADSLPWYWVLIIPIIGGLIVGLLLHYFTPDGRARSVAEVIEGAAMREGRVERKAGLVSALASMITLGSGGSSGREGPVVHLAAVISTWVSDKINATGVTARDLLGCATAAAVSASFNAPIAGALFALEVVLRHFAIHAFAPIVIASVAGTVVSRLAFGDVVEFQLETENMLEFYAELPAFLLLGLICGLVAAALMRSIFFADDVANRAITRIGCPGWLRPTLAGGILGLVAIWYPHIIGVGYETTFAALQGEIGLREVIVFTLVKVFAVAVTLGGRMGGGVFSPSLMVGALTGLAFGLIATSLLPAVSSQPAIYALAGMGAVSAAVLGAPISTTLIVFELTGDWQIGIAVMLAVSLATSIGSKLVSRSFFLTQLERRGIYLAAGPHAYLLALYKVSSVMRPVDAEYGADAQVCEAFIKEGVYLNESATLERAMPMFDSNQRPFIPVVRQGAGDTLELRGALFQVDALRVYNQALAKVSEEEHG